MARYEQAQDTIAIVIEAIARCAGTDCRSRRMAVHEYPGPITGERRSNNRESSKYTMDRSELSDRIWPITVHMERTA
jgi:hypothetical protein